MGIDPAKNEHAAGVMDRAGDQLMPPLVFQPDQEGVRRLLEKVDAIAGELGATPLFALEATGIYHLPVYVELENRGYVVRVYNPLQLRAFRKKNLRKTKDRRHRRLPGGRHA